MIASVARSFLVGALLAMLAACGSDETAGAGDASAATDAGGVDSGVVDDAPTTDAAADAGPCSIDGVWCEDGNPCTVADHCVAGACEAGPDLCECTEDVDCKHFDDGDLCNGVYYCDTTGPLTRCRPLPNSAVTCPPDGKLCTVSACSPAKGSCESFARPDGTPCSDGDACTYQDRCEAGKCVAEQAPWCTCGGDDCAAKNQADLCEGTWYCDKSAAIWQCTLNPATAIHCAPDKDTECLVNACQPGKGTCAMTPVADGSPCDDGSPCTTGDACSGGACGGKDVCACTHDIDCLGLDDGDLCNGTPYCDKASGTCKAVNPATVVHCPSAAHTACRASACSPATGLCAPKAMAPGSACEDGDKCTSGESCVGGVCKAAVNVCKCTQQADCKDKDDGDLCNGVVYCDLVSGTCRNNPATAVICKKIGDTRCRRNACDPSTGTCHPKEREAIAYVCPEGTGACTWVALPAGATPAAAIPCEDGNKCTVGDACKAGSCAPGQDICVCQGDGDCAPFEDGDPCNGTLFCDKSGAQPTCRVNPKTVVQCGGPAPTCRRPACLPQTGKCGDVPLPDGTTCSDDRACTRDDACAAGQCRGVAVCGCEKQADCAAKEDGNACNGTLYCDRSSVDPGEWKCAPTPNSEVFCPPATKPCVVSACRPSDGACVVQPADQGKACDDGSACTVNTACNAGVCSGTALACDDGLACTADGCDPVTGCVHGKSACDDGNACTLDICAAKTGACSAKPLPGLPCNADDNGCTVGDVCVGTTCTAGTPLVCKNKTGPCRIAKCTSQGGGSFACVAVPATDGTDCDDAGACQSGGKCKAGLCTGGTHDRIFREPIGGDTLPRWFYDAAPSGDGGAILVGGRDPKPALPGTDQWWLVRVDALGKAVWERGIANQASNPKGYSETAEAVVRHGGGWVVLGYRTTKTAPVLHAEMIDGAGKPVWSRDHGTGAGANLGLGLARFATGGLALVGERRPSGTTRAAVIIRTDSSGQVVWERDHEPSVGGPSAHAVVFGPGGGLLVAGRRGTSGKTRAWLASWSASGKLRWQTTLPALSGGVSAELAGLAPGSGGVVHGVGTSTDAKGLSHPLRVTADLATGVVRRRQVSAQIGSLRAIRAAAGGRFAVSGWLSPDGTARRPAALLLDAFDNIQWQASYGEADSGVADGLAVLGDGGLAIAARTGSGTSRRAEYIRASRWGQASCALAGQCLKTAYKDCDDGRLCTADLCDPLGGCAHFNADAFACLPADGCSLEGRCEKGACMAGSAGLLYARPVGEVTDARVIGVVPDGDGLRVFWKSDHEHLLQRASIDRGGNRKGVPVKLGSINAGRWNAVIDGSKNDLYVWYRDADWTHRWFGHVGRWDPDGKPLWSATPASAGCNETAVFEVIPRLGGGPVVLWGCFNSGQALLRAEMRDDAGKRTFLFDVPHVADSSTQYRPSRGTADTKGRTWFAFTARGKHGDSDFTVDCLTATGKLCLSRRVDAGADDLPYAVALAPESGLIVTGRQNLGGGAWRSFLMGLNEQGAKAWLWRPAQPDSTGFATIVPRADGTMTLLGTRTTPLSTTLLVRRAGPHGEPLADRSTTVGTGTVTVATAMRALPGGGYVIGGDAVFVAKRRPFIARVGPFGYATCKAAGACAAKKPEDCDDHKLCTADSCDAAKGCVHLPIPGCKQS